MEKKPKILHKFPKKPKNPKFLLKSFLMYFYHYREEDNIDDWISGSFKKLFKKTTDILLTGTFSMLALFPILLIFHYFTGFYFKPMQFPYVILAFGLLWDAWEKIQDKLVDGKVVANSALPRRK